MNKLTTDPRLPSPSGDVYQRQLNTRLYEVLRTIIVQLKAVIDCNSVNVTTTQKAVLSATKGMVVFDTTLGKLCVYNGSAWETITSV